MHGNNQRFKATGKLGHIEKHDNFPCVIFLTLKVNCKICGNNVISYVCLSEPPYKLVPCNLLYIPHFPFWFCF